MAVTKAYLGAAEREMPRHDAGVPGKLPVKCHKQETFVLFADRKLMHAHVAQLHEQEAALGATGCTVTAIWTEGHVVQGCVRVVGVVCRSPSGRALEEELGLDWILRIDAVDAPELVAEAVDEEVPVLSDRGKKHSVGADLNG